MFSIAICTPGYQPVPAIYGGAVEQLTTVLIEQNERHLNFHLDVYTLYDQKLTKKTYHNTSLIQVKNYQRFLPIRIVFSIINRSMGMLHIRKRYDYISCMMPLKVKKRHYDIIIVENNVSIFYGIKKRFPDTPVIFHLHNDFDTIEYDYDKTKERIKWIGKNAAAIWTASKYLKQRIDELSLPAPIAILENCIDKKRYKKSKELMGEAKSFRKKYHISEETFAILYCGRLSPEKGVLEVLEALRKLPGILDIKLILAGSKWFGSRKEDAYAQKLEKIIFELGEKVVLCGYVPQESMPVLYEAVQLVVIPTQCAEAFGMAALEAITMGKPCVGSACGGLLDILDESCAELIPLDERFVDNLAERILELISNKTRLNDMGKAAIRIAQKFNNNEAYYSRFEELIKVLLKGTVIK